MASDLQRKLDYILDEKANKIIPYNIRKGVEIFGVSGECVGVDSTDATATPEDIREGKTAYVNDQKITGTYKGVDISDATAKAGDILIGRTAYTANGKTTGQMQNNGILQYTPKAENQDIPAGYTSGGTVKGDANLVAENIKKGTTIFGIEGQAEDEFTDHEEYDACLELANEIQTSVVEDNDWVDTSDATATASDIILGKTAYANGEKIIGTFVGTGDPELEQSFMSAIDDSNGGNVTKLPDNLTAIGNHAFYQRFNLALNALPDTVRTIGMNAFYNCTNLRLQSLPSNLVTIGNAGFQRCSNLNLTSLPNNLTTIGHSGFSGCKNMALDSLPENLISIGNNSFTGCSNLRCISLPDGLTTIPGEAFNSCTNLALQSLPNQLVNIGRYAFYNCMNLVFTHFPNTIKEIDLYSFSRCSNLTTIEIPSGVSNYSTSTFEYCTNLTRIIGRSSTITKINQSFAAGTALEAFVLPNITAVPELHGSAFNKTPIANGTGYIYVPENLVESFKTHNQWVIYANQIKGIGEYINT